jgi:hypothetical protein
LVDRATNAPRIGGRAKRAFANDSRHNTYPESVTLRDNVKQFA